MTQFGRALSELNIEILCANTSQAKGRVERAHHTLQDRLVKELRLAGISTIEAANAFLPSFVAHYNGRFAKPADAETVWGALASSIRYRITRAHAEVTSPLRAADSLPRVHPRARGFRNG